MKALFAPVIRVCLATQRRLYSAQGSLFSLPNEPQTPNDTAGAFGKEATIQLQKTCIESCGIPLPAKFYSPYLQEVLKSKEVSSLEKNIQALAKIFGKRIASAWLSKQPLVLSLTPDDVFKRIHLLANLLSTSEDIVGPLTVTEPRLLVNDFTLLKASFQTAVKLVNKPRKQVAVLFLKDPELLLTSAERIEQNWNFLNELAEVDDDWKVHWTNLLEDDSYARLLRCNPSQVERVKFAIAIKKPSHVFSFIKMSIKHLRKLKQKAEEKEKDS